MIFKGDGSLDPLFSRSLGRQKLFWTLPISGYLMAPIRDNENFKVDDRIIKDYKKTAKMVKIRVFVKPRN